MTAEDVDLDQNTATTGVLQIPILALPVPDLLRLTGSPPRFASLSGLRFG